MFKDSTKTLDLLLEILLELEDETIKLVDPYGKEICEYKTLVLLKTKVLRKMCNILKPIPSVVTKKTLALEKRIKNVEKTKEH